MMICDLMKTELLEGEKLGMGNGKQFGLVVRKVFSEEQIFERGIISFSGTGTSRCNGPM